MRPPNHFPLAPPTPVWWKSSALAFQILLRHSEPPTTKTRTIRATDTSSALLILHSTITTAFAAYTVFESNLGQKRITSVLEKIPKESPTITRHADAQCNSNIARNEGDEYSYSQYFATADISSRFPDRLLKFCKPSCGRTKITFHPCLPSQHSPRPTASPSRNQHQPLNPASSKCLKLRSFLTKYGGSVIREPNYYGQNSRPFLTWFIGSLPITREAVLIALGNYSLRNLMMTRPMIKNTESCRW